ncbi:MAG: hypothetical protein WCG87_03800 [Bacteroidota bacterium]
MKNVYLAMFALILSAVFLSSCSPYDYYTPHRMTSYRYLGYRNSSNAGIMHPRYNHRYDLKPHRSIRYRYRATPSYNYHSYHTPLLNSDKHTRYAK